VAGELDDLKSKYAESMGISVQDVEAEDVVKSMTISSLRSVITRKTNTNETKKTAASAVDYFTQLLDMSNEDK
jgi:alpha-D-ribose 1-methylphosphonate 5-triphosphate synthase subunit PhnG